MNFYDFGFIFLFLPLVWLLVAFARRFGQSAQFACLIAASLLFYMSWDTAVPVLLAVSIVVNFAVASRLRDHPDRILLGAGIAGNLAALAYFKYALFIAENLGRFVDLPPLGRIALPLGISFFTFQQISYLVDSHRGLTPRHGFLAHALFISFFPHLLAGPIVLQSDLLHQLKRKWALVIGRRHIACGMALFTIGLAKKILVADTFAAYGSDLFAKAAGSALTTAEAWQAALAFTFQIYFDFSGYSDMAIGLAYTFGLRLPFNFNSPYKSTSVVEFWRRWHISLSRFLRTYLYYPLGGSRRGRWVTYRNLLIVMLLGGLWHGASWTFVLWGALHGGVLALNHLWARTFPPASNTMIARGLGWTATSLFIVVSWVPFRAPDLNATVSIWTSMAGLQPAASGGGMPFAFVLLSVAAALACVLLPNSQQLVFGSSRAILDGEREPVRLRWKPTPAWGLGLGTLLAVTLVWQWQMRTAPEFIYFNF